MHRNSQLVIGLGLYLLSFSSLSGDEILMRDETELREYYKAISTIRTCLEGIITSNSEPNRLNLLQLLNEPNFESSRTTDGMLLEVWNRTDHLHQNVKQVRALYTPVGRVDLLTGESSNQLDYISTCFLEKMKTVWVLSDTPISMERYKYTKKRDQINAQIEPMEPLEESRISNLNSGQTFFRILSVDGFNCKEPDQNPHRYFALLELTEEETKKDNALFSTLSGDKNCSHKATCNCFTLLARAIRNLCSSSSPRHQRLRNEEPILPTH